MRLAAALLLTLVAGCGARTGLVEPPELADASPEGGDASLDTADAADAADAAEDSAADTLVEPDAIPTEIGCGSDAECDDGVACTRDVCLDGLCSHVPLDTRCDDGLYCTGDEKCDAVKGCYTVPRNCADPISCTDDRCDEASRSCTHTPNDARCPISHVCDPALDCQARAIAHSRSDLYEIRLPSGVVKLIGPTSDTLTDIALHPSGTLYGLSFAGLCEIDVKTGACITKVIPLPSNPVGLDAAPDGTLYGAAETLVYSIDRKTGVTKNVATFPSGYSASGDVAFVGSRMLVTARGGGTDDALVEFNLATASGKVLGRTGYRCIWGVAAYGPTLYGLTCEGRVLRIDPNTGASAQLSRVSVEFWGATAR